MMAFLSCKRLKKMEPAIPSGFYDEGYYAHMASSVRKLFRKTCGHRLQDGLMRYFHLSQIKEGMRLLDLGCGSGEFLMYCALKAGVESWGIDYSAAAIKLARENYELLPKDVKMRINLERRPCTALQHFPDGYFDRIVWFSVIEHLYDWQIVNVLTEVYRILKRDGVFITETHPNKNREELGYPAARLILNILQKERKELKFAQAKLHVNIQSPQSIRRHFARAGFRMKVLVCSNYEFVNYPKWIMSVGRILRNKFPLSWIFGDEIAVIASKSPELLERWNDSIAEFLSSAVG